MSGVTIQQAAQTWQESGNGAERACAVISDAFVGREREMRSLRGAVTEALAGSTQLFVISGGPGVGKTRLAEELAKYAEASGMRTVTVRCWQPAASRFFPWQCALRFCGFAGASTQPQQSAGGKFLVAQTHRGEECALLPSGSEFYASARAIAEPIAKTALELPLLLVLEDVHLWDEESLMVLFLIGRELRRLPLLIAATYRERRQVASDSKRFILASLANQSQILPLGDLAEPSAIELIATLTGKAPGQHMMATLMRATAGNPGLIKRALNLWWASAPPDTDEDGVIACEQPIIPSSIRDAVLADLADLSPRSRQVLEVASVLGLDFELDVLCRVADLSEDAAAETLDELCAAGVIERRVEQLQCYRFRQGLVREILCCDMSQPARAALRKRIAQILKELYGACGSRAADIVENLVKSADPQAVEDAIATAQAAASLAVRECDFKRAASLYETALKATRLLPRPDRAAHCDLLIALGEAQAKAGQHQRAEAVLRSAADMAENLDDPGKIGRAALAAPWLNWLAPGTFGGLSMLLCEKALTSADNGGRSLRAILLARLAAESCSVPGRTDSSEPLIRDALAIARTECDSSALVNVLVYRDAVLDRPDVVSERLSNASEILDLARESGNRSALYFGYFGRLVSLLRLGEIDQVEATAKSMTLAAETSRDPAQLLCASFLAAQRRLMEGRFEEGEARIRECARFAGEHGLTEFNNLYWPAMLIPFREKRTNQSIEYFAEKAVEYWPAVGVYRALLSQIHLHLGKESEARFDFERLSAGDYTQLPRDGSFVALAVAVAELCAEFGDRGRAEKLYPLIEPYASRNAVFGMIVVLGPVSHYLGRLAATLGEFERAKVHYGDALRMSRKLGLRTLAAYSEFELASSILARAQNPARSHAHSLLSEVLSESRAMEMQDLEAKAHTALCSIAADLQEELNGCAEAAHSGGACGRRDAQFARQYAGSQASQAKRADSHSPACPNTSADDDQVPQFKQEGEFWTLSYRGQLVRLKNCKGLAMMAFLLAHPRQQFHVSDIANPGRKPAGDEPAELAQCSDAGPILDARAKRSYRERLRELRADLEEARSLNDTLRASSIQEEMAFLTRELASTLGLYGRDRRAISEKERARVRVTHAIRDTIAKISHHHPSLGRHLSRSIKTGVFCSYNP